MTLPFSFNSDKYDLWEIYETIKKFYPIGIGKMDGGGIYLEYPGIKALEKIVIENIHDRKNYTERWVDFTKDLATKIDLGFVGTTFGQAPSFSASLVLSRNQVENCLHNKELHFSVSLIGNYFQIYGLDTTRIMEKDGDSGYSAVNVVTTSPFEEFKEAYDFVEHHIRTRYPNHRLVPFAFGQQIISGLQVRYLDNELCSANMAIFNGVLREENISEFARGDRYYGMDNWLKR